jgi:hypothetical protein
MLQLKDAALMRGHASTHLVHAGTGRDVPDVLWDVAGVDAAHQSFGGDLLDHGLSHEMPFLHIHGMRYVVALR